jgi:hypothetical protein
MDQHAPHAYQECILGTGPYSCGKRIFPNLPIASVVAECAKLVDYNVVFHPTLVEYEDVIQIHHHKQIGERPKNIIHHPHESCWCVFQAKGHDQPFKNTFFGLEGSLQYIGLLYWYLVVFVLQINITKVFGPLELVKENFNLGNWVPVHDYDYI